MKVFLSWSGSTSKQAAEALHRWLPYMIQTCKPFISSNDISKGNRWNSALEAEFKQTHFGIICVTPYNVYCPWLNYEVGALATVVAADHVLPLLFSVQLSELGGPISHLQTTVYEEHDMFKLIKSLNEKLPEDSQIDPEVLRAAFNQWWPRL